MARNKTKRLRPSVLQADIDAYAALQAITDYRPANDAFATANGATTKTAMETKQTDEVQKQTAADAARASLVRGGARGAACARAGEAVVGARVTGAAGPRERSREREEPERQALAIGEHGHRLVGRARERASTPPEGSVRRGSAQRGSRPLRAGFDGRAGSWRRGARSGAHCGTGTGGGSSSGVMQLDRSKSRKMSAFS